MWRNFPKLEIIMAYDIIRCTLTKWVSINMRPFFFGDLLSRHPLGDQGRARQDSGDKVPWAMTRLVLLEQDLLQHCSC